MALRALSHWDDYRFPDGSYDVRGWEVRTEADDEKVGKVDDILLDAGGGLRYLDVDLGLFRKHVLLPLDRAHVESGRTVVWVDGVAGEALERVPEYDRDPEVVTDEYARRLDVAWADARHRPVADREVPVPSATEPDVTSLPLARLGELEDYRVAGDADPRGWKVITAEANTVGEVRELLVDRSRMRAAYLDCDVDEKSLKLEPLDRHVLIPVGRVRLDRRHKKVVVDGLLARDLDGYPIYGGLPLERDAAEQVEQVYARGADTDAEARTEAARERVVADSARRHFFGEGDAAAIDEARAVAERREHARRVDDALERDRAVREASDDDVEERVLADGETATLRGDGEVRIRVSGDDIIIEKHRSE